MIFTKYGRRIDIEYLFAYDGAVFVFNFYGDLTYFDPHDDSVWTWEGTDLGVQEVLAVVDDTGVALTYTNSFLNCEALDGSWYWDDANGYLYVHWYDSVGDHSVDRDLAIYAKIVSGYAAGYHELTQNVFDGVYYRPIIVGLTGLAKSIDPLKLGLISFGDSSFTLENHNGEFDDISETDAFGVPVWIYDIPYDVATLTDPYRIYTGYIDGVKNNRETIEFQVIEKRRYDNKPVCPRILVVGDYPDADDMLGKEIPVAWGDIRRGIMVPIDLGLIVDPPANPTTITFLVADPNMYAVLGIDKVYDEDDNEYTISAVNLPNCTVTVSSANWDKAGGVEDFVRCDFKAWKWEGQGFDIAGTYNNGLDIIRSGFLQCAEIPYIASTFDLIQWAIETAANTQAIGISLQSDKGFIEELIEPIVTSLQGVVDVLGDGRISYQSRDLTAAVSARVYDYEQMKEPQIAIDTDDTVSDINVEYAPDFVDDEKYLSYKYTADHATVVNRFGINRMEPISPLKTVLFDVADVVALCVEIMTTSSSPNRIITVDKNNISEDIQLFDIIGIDTGRFNDENFEYGEVLSFAPDYLNRLKKISARIIDDPNLDSAPAIPELITAFSSGVGSVTIRFTEVDDADGYYLYYTDGPINWKEHSKTYVALVYDSDGNLVYDFTGLPQGRVYYFRVSSYNTIGESDLSNVKFCYVATASGYLNMYMCDVIAGNVVIDNTNPHAGTVPAGFITYADGYLYNSGLEYQPAAFYESDLLFSPNPFVKFSTHGEVDSGELHNQYRYYLGGFLAWVAQYNAIGDVDTVLTGYQRLQYRFIFDPMYWNDSDFEYVKELN